MDKLLGGTTDVLTSVTVAPTLLSTHTCPLVVVDSGSRMLNWVGEVLRLAGTTPKDVFIKVFTWNRVFIMGLTASNRCSLLWSSLIILVTRRSATDIDQHIAMEIVEQEGCKWV